MGPPTRPPTRRERALIRQALAALLMEARRRPRWRWAVRKAMMGMDWILVITLPSGYYYIFDEDLVIEDPDPDSLMDYIQGRLRREGRRCLMGTVEVRWEGGQWVPVLKYSDLAVLTYRGEGPPPTCEGGDEEPLP